MAPRIENPLAVRQRPRGSVLVKAAALDIYEDTPSHTLFSRRPDTARAELVWFGQPASLRRRPAMGGTRHDTTDREKAPRPHGGKGLSGTVPGTVRQARSPRSPHHQQKGDSADFHRGHRRGSRWVEKESASVRPPAPPRPKTISPFPNIPALTEEANRNPKGGWHERALCPLGNRRAGA